MMDRRWAAPLTIAGFVAIAAWIVRDAVGAPSIVWMNIYRAADLPDLASMVAFLGETRLPLPPLLTLAELLNNAWDGTTRVVTVGLYRCCLVAAYALALWHARRSPARLAISFGLVFLTATTAIHPAGPWVYDLLLPTLLLAFLAFLERAQPDGAAGWAFLAGLSLALAELTRPFVIVLMPLLLLGAVIRLWPLPVRSRAAFLLPVVLLSGGWHLHQYLHFGQVAWGNHGGYNLLNAWPMIEVPALSREPDRPVAEGRGLNLDNAVHAENSRRIAGAVLAHIAANPGRSAIHVVERVARLLSAPTMFFDRYPQHWIFALYQVAVRYAGPYALLAAFAILAMMLLRPGRSGMLLAQTDNLLLLTTAAMIIVLAVGDQGEEARFLLSVLPLAAAVPVPRLGMLRPARSPFARRRRRLAAGAAVAAAIVVVEIVVAGAARLPTGAAEGRFPSLAPEPAANPGASLRVLAINIRGRHWRDADAAAHTLHECLARADVAGLPEVAGTGLLGPPEGQAERLARRAQMGAVYAPAERRWWREQTGNALLSRLPGTGWRRLPLPRVHGAGYRNILQAELVWGARRLGVLVGQIDSADSERQFAAAKALFDSLSPPSIMILELAGPTMARTALASLRGDPAIVLLLNEDQPHGRAPNGDLIAARGLRAAAAGRCPGVEPHYPGLILELTPLDGAAG